ncbi:zinc finger domain-containing protein [Propioniciclava coleopterorum]|uniref:zinc finger domain-containing protein n=1 Tax=Propioniciclava coleopterorum TaxID=2714937 RepID=UPI001FE3163B|nr:zinc finger domain-containing protein [Propioniciclava coleopterorum]
MERLPSLLMLGLRRRPEPFAYGRARRPCRRCGTPITRVTVGTPPEQRELFVCPHCQPA